MNIEPDHVLSRVNKKHMAAAGAFLAMGLASLLTATLTGEKIFLCTAVPAVFSIPFLIVNLATYCNLKKENGMALGGTLFQNSYKKEFQNWFYNYLDKTDDLTEKKYKIIFTSMWIKAKHLKGFDLMDYFPDKLESICAEIKKKNHTQEDLYSLFLEVKQPSYDILFQEDISDKSKRDIIKSVYQDFEKMGLVGKYFTYWSASQMLCIIPLQEYKLTSQDILEIQETTKKQIKIPEPFRKNLLFSELSMNYCLKIIHENIEHLGVLKRFFKTMKEDRKMSDIVEIIEKTERSEMLLQSLEEGLAHKDTSVRRQKI